MANAVWKSHKDKVAWWLGYVNDFAPNSRLKNDKRESVSIKSSPKGIKNTKVG